MNNDNLKRFSYSFPSGSALYHCVNGLIFTRDNFAYKVNSIFQDENNRNIKINNLERLREKIFRAIMANYNLRIDSYELKIPKITRNNKDDLELVKYRFISNKSDSDLEEYSGRHMIYPRTFVCKICGDMRIINRPEEWSNFDPKRCRNLSCNGEYEQVSIVMFCEDCGKITSLYYTCKEHGNNNLKLDRKEKDSLLTWKVVCRDCQKEGKRDPIDIFRFTCKHKDENNNTISDKKEKKFKPLTIKEGGIYSPVVITSIDIPPSGEIAIEDLEYTLLAIYLGKFKPEDFGLDQQYNVVIDDIIEAYGSYNQKRKKMIFIETQRKKGISLENAEQLWKSENNIDIIEDAISKIKNNYENINLEGINDYFALKNNATIQTYNQYIELLKDQSVKNIKQSNYEKVKEQFGIYEITYVPNINLISSCIGLINGINKFYEQDFVPHFNPIWSNNKTKDKIISYVYPFETEGILIDLDILKICKWLIDNHKIEANHPKNYNEAKELLLGIEENSLAYDSTVTLLHTLSHTLIRRSSIYTGLDSDSCSELIFPNNGSILIYATSNINIGGFGFIFQHSLSQWFKDIKIDLTECTLDPACIYESGACFSCLFLPEFVCSNFNKQLDRDTLLAKHRYTSPYWG